MQSKFDTSYRLCDPASFARASRIIREHRNQTCPTLLEQAFAGGVPANGYVVGLDGREQTYLGEALVCGNGDAMAYLISLNYEALKSINHDFGTYMRYPKALQALADRGHSFAGVLENNNAYFWMGARSLDPEFFAAIAKLGANFDCLATLEQWKIPAITRYAMFPESEDLVGSLLAAGADPNMRGVGGISVLHGAVTEGRTRSKAKLDQGSHVEEFENIVRAVVAAGGEIDMVDDQCRTALHTACTLGYYNKARILAEAGADHELKDREGKSPEDIARADGQMQVVQLFSAIRARRAILSTVNAAIGRHQPDNSQG